MEMCGLRVTQIHGLPKMNTSYIWYITKSISVIIVVYDVLWAGDEKSAIYSLDLADLYQHVLKM